MTLLGLLFARVTTALPVSSAAQMPWSPDRRESVCDSTFSSASDTSSLPQRAISRPSRYFVSIPC